MRVKIVAHFSDEDGNYANAELNKGIYADVRDSIGELWVKKGWAVRIPDPKPAHIEVETPEDELPSETRETATVRRTRKVNE